MVSDITPAGGSTATPRLTWAVEMAEMGEADPFPQTPNKTSGDEESVLGDWKHGCH